MREWNLELLDKAATLWLSHQRIRDEIKETPSSVNNDLVYKTSEAIIEILSKQPKRWIGLLKTYAKRTKQQFNLLP